MYSSLFPFRSVNSIAKIQYLPSSKSSNYNGVLINERFGVSEIGSFTPIDGKTCSAMRVVGDKLCWLIQSQIEGRQMTTYWGYSPTSSTYQFTQHNITANGVGRCLDFCNAAVSGTVYFTCLSRKRAPFMLAYDLSRNAMIDKPLCKFDPCISAMASYANSFGHERLVCSASVINDESFNIYIFILECRRVLSGRSSSILFRLILRMTTRQG